MPARARILICEDSATYARGLTRFLQSDGDLEVVGVCETGEETLETLPRLKPDLVTMDLELPGMDGIRATREIMRSPHAVPVLVLSDHLRRNPEKPAEALAAGALEAVPKTAVRFDDPQGQAAVELRRRLRRLARPSGGSTRRGLARVVGICASTGGPRALEAVLAELPADFPLPVLVVQHMAEGFIDGLIDWLDARVPLPVAVAQDGQRAKPGIWFAPDDAHLLLESSLTLRLDPETEDGAHRPSANMLLRSMASAVGSGAVGVVLTGMGRDGADGVDQIERAGGRVIAQDEETSAVFGMPRAAADAGAHAVLPLTDIAAALCRLPTKVRA
jgi:two-component system chemotaxis response regulator CheB